MFKRDPAVNAFYHSNEWKKCRDDYIKQSPSGGLCERCLANGIISSGKIVHHKIHLNARNVSNPNISLNFDNLELLCQKCHNEEHFKTKRRYKFDENGHVISK